MVPAAGGVVVDADHGVAVVVVAAMAVVGCCGEKELVKFSKIRKIVK